MSSESTSTSTSSRIRQFGFYRTIDSRTEEFLRLSKKRQIRQGCACAAISTAITVTIVVSVFLIYEYSSNSNYSKNKNYLPKTNWFALMNDTADIAPFEEKYSKIKFNLDKTTVKLLPILLNALSQNIYLDKIIEEYSSSSPTYEHSTDFTYNKNVLTDVRNWYKTPTSRLYAIEYKTSPVVYFRSPAENIEYLTKIRKIRDYQRILNYFDKMIGDNRVNSALPTANQIYETEIPSSKRTTASKKHDTVKTVERSVDFNKISKDKNETGCKCPKKLSELLKKLITSVSKLIPYCKLTIPICKENSIEQKSKDFTVNKKVNKTFEAKRNYNSLTEKVPKSSFTKLTNIKIVNNQHNNILQNKFFNFPLMINILKQTNRKLNPLHEILVFKDKPTTVKNYIEATETGNFLQKITKPLNNMIWKNVNNYKYPVFKDDEYEDYFATSTNVNDFDTLENNNLQLVKNKMISPINKVEKLEVKLHDLPKMDSNIKNDTKHIQKIVIKSSQIKKTTEVNQFHNKMLPKLKSSYKSTSLQKNHNKNLTQIDPPKNITYYNNTDTMEPNKTYVSDYLLNNDNIGFDENNTYQEEEFQELDNVTQEYIFKNEIKAKVFEKPTNNITIKENNDKTIIFDKTNKTEIKYNMTYDKLESVRYKEMTTIRNYNSMLPKDRPIYLEIQRREWRQDDQHDFDMNLNNNIFDLPAP